MEELSVGCSHLIRILVELYENTTKHERDILIALGTDRINVGDIAKKIGRVYTQTCTYLNNLEKKDFVESQFKFQKRKKKFYNVKDKYILSVTLIKKFKQKEEVFKI